MDAIFSLPIKEAILLLVAGLVAPAIVTLILPVIKLPAIRVPVASAIRVAFTAVAAAFQAVRGMCYIAGEVVSAFLVKRLGEYGKKMEDGLQEFVESTIFEPMFKAIGAEAEGFFRWLLFDPFWRGLDKDDKDGVIHSMAERAVIIAEQSAHAIAGAPSGEIESVNAAKKVTAVGEVKKQLANTAIKASDNMINFAVEKAVKKLSKLRKLL
jgi:hypothetical protein